MTAPTPQDWARDELGHGCFAVDLDGHVQSFHASIRDALIARGVLRCDARGVWRLHWHGWDLDRERAAWMACCDFCSARPVVWRFACDDFEMPSLTGAAGARLVPMRSTGEWEACAPCGEHINAGRWTALQMHVDAVKRESELALPPMVRRLVRTMRSDVQQRFRHHKRGDGVPIAPSPFGH